MDLLLTVFRVIFWGLAILCPLVFIHEMGHFLAARMFGVRVTEFFLGLPCKLKLSWRSKKRGTEFGITPILLGGYNRITGMVGQEDELLPEVFSYLWTQGTVSIQEIMEKFQISSDQAFAELEVLRDWGSAALAPIDVDGNRVTEKTITDAACYQLMGRDDKGRTIYDAGHGQVSALGSPQLLDTQTMGTRALYEREKAHTYLGLGCVQRIVVLLAGIVINILAAVILLSGIFMICGVERISQEPIVGGVVENSLAAKVGLSGGEKILSVDGALTTSWEELAAALKSHISSGQNFEIVYEREGAEQHITVDPSQSQETTFGIFASSELYHPNLAEALHMTWTYTATVASFVGRLLMPQHTIEILNQSSSVVGISIMASEVANTGIQNILFLLAAISMSLGFMNLLPFLPLDGGRVLIELIQTLIRRPVRQKFLTAFTYFGLALLVLVFVVVVKNDIFRFLIH